LCHGVFDLVHPGHITHLEQAKNMADILVVSITASKYVRKGPGRPYFNDNQRLSFLSAIECIDYVILSEGYTVDDIIENVEPDFYVKGQEYAKEENDLTGMITSERLLVEKHGGKVRYTGGEVFSSTRLINTAMSGLTQEVVEYMRQFIANYSIEMIKDYSDQIEHLKVLVIGDVIIDRYTYCSIQGLISKDMAYSARLKESEDYYGGAIAIARHISSFVPDVTLMSITGDEEEIYNGIKEVVDASIKLKIHKSGNIPTIIKQRFVTRNQKRDEYKKIFAINNIVENENYEEDIVIQFERELEEEIHNYDVVFVCDFGHGLIGKKIMNIVQNNAKYLVLNCQTNSSNKGKNLITKYKRADFFTLDQSELSLAYPGIMTHEDESLSKLSEHLGGSGCLTRGPLGAYSVDYLSHEVYECPAFALSVKDTIGAGDAFFAISGLYAAVEAPVELSMIMGNIAGALGANIIGNKNFVEKSNVLKYASTLMNI